MNIERREKTVKSDRSTRRSKLVGGLLSEGVTRCPCCGVEMFMRGEESEPAFVSRYAKSLGGITPSKAETARRVATVDHIVPQARGGGDLWENFLVICQGCNCEKGDLSVKEWINLRKRIGNPFKRLTAEHLLALYIRARQTSG